MLRRVDAGIVAVAALALPALSALAQSALPRGGDLLLHFYRLVALDSCIHRGLFYSRWMPDLVFGYGYPLFHFYAPLSAYLGEAFHLAGADFALSVRLVSAAALLGVAVGTYLWTRDLFNPRAGFVAAVAALYAPFVLSTPLSRGSISDAVALAILPFAFWTLDRLRQRPTAPRLVTASLTLAALVLSHNVTALIAFPILGLYTLAGALETRRGAGRFAPFLALALGLGLAAFFWYPALADNGWTRLDLFIADAQYDYRSNFLSLGYLFRLPARAEAGLMNPEGPYHINLLVPVAGVVGLVGTCRVRREGCVRAASLWLAGILLLYLSLASSAWLWSRLPLLPLVQFPFRLLGPAGVVLAPPAAALFTSEGGKERTWVGPAAAAIFIVALIVPSLPLLYPLRQGDLPACPTLADVSRFQSGGALGTTSSGEYLPKTIVQVPAGPAFAGMDQGANLADKLDRVQLPPSVRMDTLATKPLLAEWRTDSPVAFGVTVNTFYFPGWQARLDGKPLEVSPASQSGLIHFTVPAGEHELALYFGSTAVTRLGDGVSLVAVAALLALLATQRRRWGQATVEEGAAAHAPGRNTAIWAAFGVALLIAKAAYVDRIDNPWRLGYEGQGMPLGTQAIGIDLGAQVRLLAMDPLPSRLAPGSRARLVLYWAALKPLDRDYTVSVQVLDDRANKAAQVEHYHPGGYPATWWRVGEYNRDEYLLEISPTAAPGRYRVLVVLYDRSGRHLLPGPDVPGVQSGGVEVQQVEVGPASG